MKRILKCVAIASGGCLALLLVIGAVWEELERRQVAAAFPAPGLEALAFKIALSPADTR